MMRIISLPDVSIQWGSVYLGNMGPFVWSMRLSSNQPITSFYLRGHPTNFGSGFGEIRVMVVLLVIAPLLRGIVVELLDYLFSMKLYKCTYIVDMLMKKFVIFF
jgi:hypothetical protein